MSFIFLRNRVTGGAAFTPASLFSSGEQGAWYEPSTTTCFTDTAGTTAATYGNAVARINDLSGNGNHATQATEPARPILARVPEGGRRNLLERTEEFDNAAWLKTNVSASANVSATTDPNGNNTAEKLVENADTAKYHQIWRGISGTAGPTLTFSVYLKAAERSDATLLLRDGGSNFAFCAFDLSAGTVGSTSTAGTGYSGVVGAISDEGNGWYRCSVTATRASAYTPEAYIEINDGTTRQYNGDGTSGVYIWGAQLEAASSATAYQKVVDQYDITEAGVTSLEYLAFDGANDSFVISGSQAWYDQYIGSIVIAASTNSTADQDVVSNRGADNPGVRGKYALSIRNSGVNWNYDNLVVVSGVATSTASPINTPYVFYGSGDGTNVSSSINSGSVTTATDIYTARGLDAYIGQSGNSNTYFSGRIYGIVLTNDVLTAQEISDTEAYLAAKSGVTL